MPRYNVQHNGKWACFSSVVDAFVTCFMDRETYGDWRKREYGEVNHKPIEQCNMMGMEEAVFSTTLNRSRESAIECLLECGFTAEEAEQIMYDCETKYYCPIPDEGGNYECPNCHEPVFEGQKECTDEFCNIRLVWR